MAAAAAGTASSSVAVRGVEATATRMVRMPGSLPTARRRAARRPGRTGYRSAGFDAQRGDGRPVARQSERMDGTASVVITLALVFYTIGVWSERFAGRLKPWHLVFFWLGLACDTIGTGMMLDFAGGMTFDVHGLTGLLAILLMLVHATWATIVLLRPRRALDPQLPPVQHRRLGDLADPVLQPDVPRDRRLTPGAALAPIG